MSVPPAQAKDARLLVGWSQRPLAGKLFVGPNQAGEYERRKRRSLQQYLAKLRHVFESAGVEFTNGNQPGVSMRIACK
jgi:transcriptional regulator with XRE-family HTH domain